MAASTQVLSLVQGFVQLLAKLRAILRADSRNSLRSTATTGFALLPSKQSVDDSDTSGYLRNQPPAKGKGWQLLIPTQTP